MKTNNHLLILLALIALVLSSLACGSTTASAPAAAPKTSVKASCVTPAMLKEFIREYYGIAPSFAYDPDITTWDKSYTKEWANESVIISYDESGGCLTALGVVTLTNWGSGDFGKTGSYIGLLGAIAEDESSLDWIGKTLESCANSDQDERRTGRDGSIQQFVCEDLGPSILVGVSYHLR